MKLQQSRRSFVLLSLFLSLSLFGCIPLPNNPVEDDETTQPTPITDLRMYVFGHSLFTWDAQSEPGSYAQSSVGYWLGALAGHSGLQSAVTGQFGQLSYHAVPPTASWGFSTNTYEPWPDGTFDEQNFVYTMIMPSNFEQYDTTPEDYREDTERVLDWVTSADSETQIIIYEHWPETNIAGAPGDDLSAEEWATYRNYTLTTYHEWFLEYQELVADAYSETTVRMIPVGPVLTDLLNNLEVLSSVVFTDLYADDAPHGTRSQYFLTSLVMFRALFHQNPSGDYTPPADMVISQIEENLPAIVDYIDSRLDYYNGLAGDSRVRVYD